MTADSEGVDRVPAPNGEGASLREASVRNVSDMAGEICRPAAPEALGQQLTGYVRDKLGGRRRRGADTTDGRALRVPSRRFGQLLLKLGSR